MFPKGGIDLLQHHKENITITIQRVTSNNKGKYEYGIYML